MGGTPTAAAQTPMQGQGQGQDAANGAAAGAGAAAGGQPAGGAMPQEGTEAWNQFAAYWAAYGYDVKDERCEFCFFSLSCMLGEGRQRESTRGKEGIGRVGSF